MSKRMYFLRDDSEEDSQPQVVEQPKDVFQGNLPDGFQIQEGVWNIILEDTGPLKIQILKFVRETTGLGLKEAKDLVDSVPARLLNTDNSDVVQLIVNRLKGMGARAFAMFGNYPGEGIMYK